MTAGGDAPPAPRRRSGWWRAGVRGRLLALIVAATVPIAIAAGGDSRAVYRAALEQGPRDVVILREAAVARHGAAVASLRETLFALAQEPGLLGMAPEACDAMLDQVRRLAPRRYSNFWVMDAEGVRQCSAVPAPRGQDVSSAGYIRAARSSRSFVLGDFTIGVVTHRAVLPAAVPVLAPDDTVVALVGGGLFLDFFLEAYRGAESLREHHVWLLDDDGTTLPLGSAVADALPPQADLERMLHAPEATLLGPARDGTAHAWASEQLEAGLVLLVGLPVAAAQAAARDEYRRRVIALMVFVAGCLGAIVMVVELGVARPLRELAARVRIWQPGRPYAPAPEGTSLAEVRDLDGALTAAAAALQEREQALTAALQQRDLLMAEIHHRVKNNLQIVASLLSLQAGRVRSEAARHEFAVARDRVQALATLHRHLYMNQPFQRMSLRPFLEELAQELRAAICGPQQGAVTISVEADEIELNADEAISVALLLTEAVSNAMQHAFPDGRGGTIAVSVRREGDEILLRVSDDGIGMDEAARSGDGLGVQLIEGFAAHLGGAAEFSADGGTTLVVRFPPGGCTGS